MASRINDKWSILIVDDDQHILDSLRRTLAREEFDLTCVNDPQSAIDLMSQKSFDLLLSDIDMPGISGHEVMKTANRLQPKMIRVFVTGRSGMETAVRAINEGEVHRFVRKPFQAEDLRELVRAALDRKAELDLVSEASSRTHRRSQLFEQLEIEHPGITKVSLDENGVYVVKTEAISQVAESVGLTRMLHS
jgi:DNA-binding NtrC family response regulator